MAEIIACNGNELTIQGRLMYWQFIGDGKYDIG